MNLKMIVGQFSEKECKQILDLITYSDNENFVGGLIEVNPALEIELFRKSEHYDFIYNGKKYQICKTPAYKFYDNEDKLIGFIEGKVNKKNINYFHIDSFAALENGKGYGEKMLLQFSEYIKKQNFSLCSSLHAINYWTKLERKLNGIIKIDIS